MIICKKYCTPLRCIKHTTMAGYMHLLVGYGAEIKELGAIIKKRPKSWINENNFQDLWDYWLITRLKPYQNINFRLIDIIHLESLSCLKVNLFVDRGLNEMFTKDKFSYDFEKMKDVQLRDSMKKVWNEGLKKLTLHRLVKLLVFLFPIY